MLIGGVCCVIRFFSSQESPAQGGSEQHPGETHRSAAGSPPPDPSSPTLNSRTADPALISEDIDINDFLPKSPNPDSLQVDMALKEINSDLPEVCPTAQLVDYDFSAPFFPLEDITGQASAQPRPHWGPAVQLDVIQKCPSLSRIPLGETVSQVQESLPKSSVSTDQYTPEEPSKTSQASVCGHPSQASVQITDGSGSVTESEQEGEVASLRELKSEMGRLESKVVAAEAKAVDDAVKLHEQDEGHQNVVTGLSNRDGMGPQAATSQDTPVDLTAGELLSDTAAPQPSPNTHGHSSDAHIKVGQFVSEVTAPLPAPSVHGHVSNSHIKIGEHVSEVDAPLPSHSAYGHSSDAHIKVSENVSEFVAPLLTPNVHGHPSDAHIRVGEHVPDVLAPLPSASVYGHSSDSRIKVGENVSDVAAPLPSPSIHGHSSDANIKVGEFVSNIPEERPRWSKYGHASDCTLQIGCVVSGSESPLSALPGSSYGHSSDSALGIGCVVSGEEPRHSPLPGSAHGHSSDSNLGIGCVVSKPEQLPSPLPGSAYGHSSDSRLGVGCVVLGAEPQPSVLPGSAYGHSSDSSLGVGCVVKGKSSGNQQMEDHEDGKGNE